MFAAVSPYRYSPESGAHTAPATTPLGFKGAGAYGACATLRGGVRSATFYTGTPRAFLNSFPPRMVERESNPRFKNQAGTDQVRLGT